MMIYLENGWFEPDGEQKLRSEVVDGAMDIAGMMIRAKVGAGLLHSLALKVRTSLTAIDPQMKGDTDFHAKASQVVSQRLEGQTEQIPELHAFVADCLDHVESPRDLIGFYLHLMHIGRMIQLLSQASAL
ncbi:MAG: hypothetical protein HOI23_16750 [Deltaproteobacteria bacterium]|jgi:hypothetical protein|nr:hypothetical protein [Deltaproteobacteria bacterium]MBT6435458.1 hypothetical protein [Deltaproteobacteria bacterium]MBT6490146.1 hypothetical protein [Deltaproteobacteria bacterium]